MPLANITNSDFQVNPNLYGPQLPSGPTLPEAEQPLFNPNSAAQVNSTAALDSSSGDAGVTGRIDPAQLFDLPDSFQDGGLFLNSGSFRIDTIDLSLVSEFYITYRSPEQEPKTKVFQFALPPSMESFTAGPGQTPEVKPGILRRSGLNIKTFKMPGGKPIYQVLGHQPEMLQLTGLFVGAEQDINGSEGLFTEDKSYLAYSQNTSLNASYWSNVFQTQVVEAGSPVELTLFAAGRGPDPFLKFKIQCLIQNCRYFLRRGDRIFYALDVIVLEFLEGDNSVRFTATEFNEFSQNLEGGFSFTDFEGNVISQQQQQLQQQVETQATPALEPGLPLQ